MVWLDVALALTALTATSAAARLLWRHERRIELFSMQLGQDAARLVELRYLHDLQRQVADAQNLTETAIDSGTAAVRAVHLGISRIPFGILEAIPITRDTTRVVRQTHDLISEAVYGSIRGINRVAGHATRGALGARRSSGSSAPDDNDE